MGALNRPIRAPSSNVYRAQNSKRLILPQHWSSMGGSLKGDKHDDQVTFHAGDLQDAYSGMSGVFDFDRAPFFGDAWAAGQGYFNAAAKHRIADHRPLWAQFDI